MGRTIDGFSSSVTCTLPFEMVRSRDSNLHCLGKLLDPLFPDQKLNERLLLDGYGSLVGWEEQGFGTFYGIPTFNSSLIYACAYIIHSYLYMHIHTYVCILKLSGKIIFQTLYFHFSLLPLYSSVLPYLPLLSENLPPLFPFLPYCNVSYYPPCWSPFSSSSSYSPFLLSWYLKSLLLIYSNQKLQS